MEAFVGRHVGGRPGRRRGPAGASPLRGRRLRAGQVGDGGPAPSRRNAYPFESGAKQAAAADPPNGARSTPTTTGRFHLHAAGDVVGGATVEAALQEAKDALFQAGEHDASWWDALVEVAERSLATVS